MASLARGALLSETRRAPPYSLSNYTPLYYGLLGAILYFTDLSFLPGRGLSLGMGVGVLFFVYRIVFYYSGDKASGITASLVLLASPFAGNLALNRVDATAAFFSLGAIALLLTKPRSQCTALASGALAALAALTRQTSFIFPMLVAGGLFIGEKRWRDLGAFLVALICIAGGVSGGLELKTSGAYSFNVILSNINSFEWDRIVLAIGSIGQSFYAPLIAVVFILFQRRDACINRPLLLILIVAALPSFLSIAKSGSNLNYLTEMYGAIAVIFGVVVGGVTDHRKKSLILALVVGALAAPRFESAKSLPNVALAIPAARVKAAETVRFIKALPGPILTDDLMGLELLAGKKIVFQPYEVNQLQRVGRWHDRGIRKILRTRRVTAVLVSAPYRRIFVRKERWSAPQWRLVRRNYRARKHFFGSAVYVPRR